MADKKRSTATLEDVRLIFRNFSGNESQYNAKGVRNFCVVLPTDVADAMAADGYNIKQRPPREEGDDPLIYLKVNVNFNGARPPQVVLINSRGRTTLDEADLNILDWADIQHVDLIISPYVRDWPDGRTTVTAYLQKIFVTIQEDELEEKYADVPFIGDEPQGNGNGPRFEYDD